MMKDFTNKVVWITGASSGIGEALTKQLAALGAQIIISARRKSELERVKKACNHDSIYILPLDLGDQSNFGELVKEVIDQFGRIDYLINNGGISQRSSVDETSMAVDRKIMEVNFFGNIALTKEVLPYMIKQKSGHFVILSSLAGKFGFFLRSSYAASKHALQGFYESLRFEQMKNNIHVTFVCPGFVRTNMAQNALRGDGQKHNLNDNYQNNGISPEVCASAIIKAVSSNKEEVIIGGKETKAVLLKRLFPGFFTRIMVKQKPTG